MLMQLSRLALLSVSVMLAGCQTKTPTVSVATKSAPFCKVAEPIFYHAADTVETVKQIREHNAVGAELCKW